MTRLGSGPWRISRSDTITGSSTAPSPTSSWRWSSTVWRIGILRNLEIRRLGLVSYTDALAVQRALVEDRQAGRIDDLLIFVEHPHVLTLGVRGDGGRSHILAAPDLLAARGVDVHETGRGGDITYHGPGQIVGYPIIDLKPDRCDVHRYVRDLEDVLIRTVADYGLDARRIAGLTGVWVGDEKLAAIGVRIARWVTSHGFALNVSKIGRASCRERV